MTVVNAGHMSPYLRHADGTVEKIGEEEKGLPLGVIADARVRRDQHHARSRANV